MSNSFHEGHDRQCDHKIKYCKKCDTTYCEYNGCNAEWTKPNWTFTTTTPNVYPQTTTVPYAVNNYDFKCDTNPTVVYSGIFDHS